MEPLRASIYAARRFRESIVILRRDKDEELERFSCDGVCGVIDFEGSWSDSVSGWLGGKNLCNRKYNRKTIKNR